MNIGKIQYSDLTRDRSRIPSHIAIIMDGNGRWAKQQGLNRVNGHNEGVNSARDAIEASVDLNVKYLTLYVFSKENWNRPEFEVNCLMALLVETIFKEIDSLMEKNVRVVPIGEIDDLPRDARKSLDDVIFKTKDNSGMTLFLAISYSGREEIVKAVNRIINDGIKNIDENIFKTYLYAGSIPDPELMIRTGGDLRISNFLLWQCAYTELYISDKFWPDFRKEDFLAAIADYQKRERRFGKTSEQIRGEKN
ncbi:TPA: di-trans,poly-cis-decaprenylcistransferase [Candidatus Delongbacteria bacterium]|nr:MAG: di-trans,poly-cis-decaprenylcistransferase [Candidatus Delongbacteria bacterium GWF2_40_14]HAQ62154.1 di-trans,poly-cis-decaprenylcistransferase [Candidatus Delongbacteria bacterium]